MKDNSDTHMHYMHHDNVKSVKAAPPRGSPPPITVTMLDGFCSRTIYCYTCLNWSAVKLLAESAHILSVNFFERRELRCERILRAVCIFVSNFERVVNKDDILKHVWGNNRAEVSVSVLIYDLRILLKNESVTLNNVRGKGYVLGRK